MPSRDECLAMLPSTYNTDPVSNIYKLFDCICPEFDLCLQTIDEISKCLDVDYAWGMTLDKIGKNVNMPRGMVTDLVLRTLIKTKVAADMSEGTVKVLNDVISFILGTTSESDEKSQIVELWNSPDPDKKQPAAFEIFAPLDSILMTGVSLLQFEQLIMRIKAGGVGVLANFGGTFEFGETTDYGPSYDTGFSDTDQTTGGTLSALQATEDDTPLPI